MRQQQVLRWFRGLVFAWLCVTAAELHSQTLTVTPAEAPVDQVATIRAAGLQPHERVSLKADLVDGANQPWASEAEFVADESGIVDTAKMAPVKGSYRTVSAMGLVWSMMPTAKDVQGYRTPRGYGTQTIGFQLVVNGKPAASAHLDQIFLPDGAKQIRLKGALHGILFLPDTPGPHPGMLVLGGSEGGLPPNRAIWLASHGYAALALAYFRYDDLPANLAGIPLEYFGQALGWMSQRPEIDSSRIGVMGTSGGGELALQLGSIYPQIKTVVAYVPANVRYPSCCGRPYAAAWTLGGHDLAYAIPVSRGPIPQSSQTLAATIPVEQSHGPILLISGDDDGIWSSSTMTDAVLHRLKQAHYAFPVERLNYTHAGHRAGNPAIIPAWIGNLRQGQNGEPNDPGGTPEGNAESSLDAIPKVLAFLQQAFAATPSK